MYQTKKQSKEIADYLPRGRTRRNRPARGIRPPRPLDLKELMARVLYALDWEACDCHRAWKARMAQAMRPGEPGKRRQRQVSRTIAEALEIVGPPCEHVLQADHSLPVEAWLELLHRYDITGMIDPPPPPRPMPGRFRQHVSGGPSLRVAVYQARAESGHGIFHPGDRQDQTEQVERLTHEARQTLQHACFRQAVLDEARQLGAARGMRFSTSTRCEP